ncbi:MAG TPA: MFS transporter [Burkholderiales bacterium]
MPETLPPEADLPPPGDPSPYAPFRLRDFRLYVIMVMMSSIAQQAQAVAIGWDIYDRTHSALALGWTGLVQFIPVLAFFLPAGQIADRHDRRLICGLSLVVWLIGAAVLAASARLHTPVGWIYVSVAFTGLSNVLNRAARDALLPQIAPPDILARAVTWNATIFQIASVAGPTLAGALIALGGSAFTVYAMDVVCIFVATVVAFSIVARPPTGPKRATSWREMFGGLEHVWKTKVVFAPMTIDLFAVLLGGATALLPLYAKDILHVGAGGLGWLSAGPALGAVLMAVSIGHAKKEYHAGRSFLWAVGIFGLATVVFGLSTNYWISLLALVVIGASDNYGAVIRQTSVQLHTPDELRGRVSAVNRVFISSSNELGAVESGIAASFIGAVPAVVAGGAITLLIAAFGLKIFPALNRLESIRRYDKI